jgi:SAM-dependent methyltransferase
LADPADPHLARWNQRFSAADYVFGTAPNAFLKAQAHRLKPGMTALAVADGEGRNGVFLARQGLAVLSVDFSPVGQAKARRLAEQHGVKLATECADLAEWQWGAARFDVVAGIFIQFAAPELRTRIFAGMRSALRPGGLVLIQGYRPQQLGYGTGGPTTCCARISPVSKSCICVSMIPRSTKAAAMTACRRWSIWWRASPHPQKKAAPLTAPEHRG